MSLAQGFPNTFSATQQTQEVLKNTDNETKKIYTDINAFMAYNGHAHTGNGSDGAKINISNIVINSAINEVLGTPIASASTINLTTATGNFLHITGTTTITAVTLGAGMRREIIFDGILTLTHHATNNNLPSGANITTAVGDRASYHSDGATVYCTKYQRADGTAVIEPPSSGGEILQLRIFNNATTPTTKMDITANNVPLYDASYNPKKSGVISLTADLGANGVNGLDAGSKSNSTGYYLYVIGKLDGTIAGLWSLSATSPTMPSGYIYKRRIGWDKTDSSGNLLKISGNGNDFSYVVPQQLSSGAQGTINNTTFTPVAIALSSFCPSTTQNVRVTLASNNINTPQGVAPNNTNYNGYDNSSPPTIYSNSNRNVQGIIFLESTNIYYASGGGALLLINGWRDNI